VELKAKCTIFAEECRGHLSKQVIKKFDLAKDSGPMSYGIGFKQVWELDPSKHRSGYIEHTLGWPLTCDQYGGSFLYHIEDGGQPLAAVGFVIALDYKNPYLNPFKVCHFFVDQSLTIYLGVPTLQDSSKHFKTIGRWNSHWLWCSCSQRRRLSNYSEVGVSRWLSHWLFRWLTQRF
jgi:flavin-dependent dehydrogenase